MIVIFSFSESEMMSLFGECSKLGCLAQVLAENQTLVERSTKDVLAQGVKGPEGFAYAHTESAEETATMSAAVMADQVTFQHTFSLNCYFGDSYQSKDTTI